MNVLKETKMEIDEFVYIVYKQENGELVGRRVNMTGFGEIKPDTGKRLSATNESVFLEFDSPLTFYAAHFTPENKNDYVRYEKIVVEKTDSTPNTIWKSITDMEGKDSDTVEFFVGLCQHINDIRTTRILEKYKASMASTEQQE